MSYFVAVLFPGCTYVAVGAHISAHLFPGSIIVAVGAHISAHLFPGSIIVAVGAHSGAVLFPGWCQIGDSFCKYMYLSGKIFSYLEEICALMGNFFKKWYSLGVLDGFLGVFL